MAKNNLKADDLRIVLKEVPPHEMARPRDALIRFALNA
jgi:hypothetical protein